MIPNRVFFIWFGNKLPLTTGLAILSTKQVQKPEETILYIESDENELSGEGYELIKDVPGITLKKIDDNIFADLGDNGICKHLYDLLKKPVSKTNLLRYALLYKQGGVYLDTDIITVKPWDDLLQQKGFCGLEPVAFPQKLFASKNPFFYLFAWIRFFWRLLCVYLPHGEQIFRPTEKFFSFSANGAILGSEAGNAFFEKAFAEINAMAQEEQLKHYRLGTHIMQKVTQNKSSEIMELFPPAYFYPLGPDISMHLFRKGSAKRLDKILLPQTRIIHWYNSVEKKYLRQQLNKKWLEEHPTSAFAKLAQDIIGAKDDSK
ncbi:MAG: hypothetical protein LBU89_07685 [Fibromonadaceae bacterium]|jgi:hypothetical protein|nr:hypothetical protein [Fibromonadaceae bacterium]